ncbi:VIT1/CCC1 transporter family protein [Thiomicrorhabdus sediminis]|uniref:VIT family protein n=1 Tax=Thiomicrorhabdus sediminis TaxID=2580412 RepID=A0A4P9K4K8_9GAMM|nr:VIT family protein [Thiomicrorhabdus sediminis]QCU89661.1 VIT family protein [Thiomicrorhabdus sediminis]
MNDSQTESWDIDLIDQHIEEQHFSHRMGWLRAAVLGANDGIISVVSLIVGVYAAGAERDYILLVAIAALAAGALSMAAGEYVSVSSQSDTEKADLAIERQALADNWEEEKAELAGIYMARGVSEQTAFQVAHELMEHDALDAHMRDELGLSEIHSANPLQAAFASACSFIGGGIVPVLVVVFFPYENLGWTTAISSLILLGILGAIAAWIGGANKLKGGIRMVIWGSIAMAVTTWVGMIFGVAG